MVNYIRQNMLKSSYYQETILLLTEDTTTTLKKKERKMLKKNSRLWQEVSCQKNYAADDLFVDI